MYLIQLVFHHPLQALVFLYTFVVQSLLVLLRRTLLPHISQYQSVRLQLQRAYLSSCSATFPDLTHRLPVGPVPDNKAKRVGTDFTGYLIPGYKNLKADAVRHSGHSSCVILYAHGGGYARGEAKMYIKLYGKMGTRSRRSWLEHCFSQCRVS